MIATISKGFFANTHFGSALNTSLVMSDTGNNEKLLNSLTLESKSVLFQFKSTFPFDFFPDTITIDESKVNITSQDFFLCSHVRSILISNISDISIDTGVFFATISIIDSSNYRFPIIETLRYVKKSDAIRARELIQGLILAKSKNISLSNIPIAQVRKEMCALGQS
jgi:hypothetical protein